MIFLRIYAEFFIIGLFSIGGGLATLPFLYNMAEKYQWLSRELVSSIQALAQTGPGAIGINMAAQTGAYYAASLSAARPETQVLWQVLGGLAAALGEISPSVLLICLIARALQSFRQNRLVNAAFGALQPAAGGLLASAGLLALGISNMAPLELLVFVLLFLAVYRFKAHPVVYIAAGGLLGLLFQL
jgi:chromate transporter